VLKNALAGLALIIGTRPLSTMVKFECPHCGQSMQTAQYLNGKGHCLKCDAVVAHTEKHPLNPEWVRKMKDKFDKLNTDGKANKAGYGTLDFDEMSALLLKGNKDLKEDELRSIFAGADTNGNGSIEFTEFLWFLYGSGGGGGGGGGAKGRPAGVGGDARRVSGEASTHKLAPSDACESDSGVCGKNNGGPHHFKFGQCQHCKIGEGKINAHKGGGDFANQGGGAECEKGGKCMFKFSKCTKCGRRE